MGKKVCFVILQILNYFRLGSFFSEDQLKGHSGTESLWKEKEVKDKASEKGNISDTLGGRACDTGELRKKSVAPPRVVPVASNNAPAGGK